MTGVRGQHLTPGEFRTSQNWTGPAGCTLESATFVPPPVPEMNEALVALEKYLHAPSLDGNGRVGRLLISLLLCEEKLLPAPLLYLSAFFERRHQEYYGHLLAVSQRGLWEAWVDFFLEGVAEQSADAVQRAGRLRKLQDEYRRRIETPRASALLGRLVDAVFDHPALTITGAARLLKVTPRAASLNVEKLVRAGILEEATGRARGRIFIARELVRAIEEDLRPRERARRDAGPGGATVRP